MMTVEAERDAARLLVRELCLEWHEACTCAELPLSLGHGDECPATNLRAAKVALRLRAERAERECDVLRAAIDVLQAAMRLACSSWKRRAEHAEAECAALQVDANLAARKLGKEKS